MDVDVDSVRLLFFFFFFWSGGGCGGGGGGLWRFCFPLLLFVVIVDLASGSDGGWMWWSAMLRIVGLRKRETDERGKKMNKK